MTQNIMNKTYTRILAAASEQQFDILKQIKESLSTEMEMMDQFFEEFLAKNAMDRRKKTNDSWTIYTKKTAEYCEVVDNLKIVDYYLEKFNV